MGEFTWFAGTQGLFRYRTSENKPDFVIDRITTDRELKIDEPVQATTDNKLLTVSFHAITPSMRNGSTLYRYRLKGQTEEWSEARENHVELRDLPIGEYAFELQAFDRNLNASNVLVVPIGVSVPSLRYARDAMPNGGVLRVSIEAFTRGNQPWGQVTIRDSGKGISPENLERIFEPFFTTKHRGKGTGLGLAMAQAILRGHDGTIAAESTEKPGTCFTICLPQTNTHPSKMDRVTEEFVTMSERFNSDDRVVLVADDREPVRKAIVQMLERLGFHVVAADNGAQALEIACTKRPDILLLDVDMPILDGLTVHRKVRSSGYDTPAVIVSGAPVRGEIPRNTVVLLKPFTAEQLRDATGGRVGAPAYPS